MDPFDCPTCDSKTWKLIYAEYDPTADKLVCPNCYKQQIVLKVGLHDPFPGSQSKGLTNGKAWEIENRVVSPDDKMVYINKKTGRETQY